MADSCSSRTMLKGLWHSALQRSSFRILPLYCALCRLLNEQTYYKHV